MQWKTNLPRAIVYDGMIWSVDVVASERADGTWEGHLAFRAGSRSVSTGEETSQPNRKALEYWATGLEPIYLEGALQRALDLERRRTA